MKKNNLITLIFLLILISCRNSDDKKVSVDNDLKKIIMFIKSNENYFMNNNNDKYPGVFYTSRIGKLSKSELFNKNDLLSLLIKKNITKIYFYSQNEIWLVYKEEKLFIKNRESLIGMVNENSIESAWIMNSYPSRIKILGGDWYSLIIKYSIID